MFGDGGLAVVIVPPTRRRSICENTTGVVPARVQVLPGRCYRHRKLLVIVSAPAHHCPIRRIRAGVLVDVGKEARMPLEPVQRPVAVFAALSSAPLAIRAARAGGFFFTTHRPILKAVLLEPPAPCQNLKGALIAP